METVFYRCWLSYACAEGCMLLPESRCCLKRPGCTLSPFYSSPCWISQSYCVVGPTGVASLEAACGPDSSPLAAMLDQLSLLQFLRGALDKAEASASRALAAVAASSMAEPPALAMCRLRLGAVLAGAVPSKREVIVSLYATVHHGAVVFRADWTMPVQGDTSHL